MRTETARQHFVYDPKTLSLASVDKSIVLAAFDQITVQVSVDTSQPHRHKLSLLCLDPPLHEGLSDSDSSNVKVEHIICDDVTDQTLEKMEVDQSSAELSKSTSKSTKRKGKRKSKTKKTPKRQKKSE